jgi:hypothetical protein
MELINCGLLVVFKQTSSMNHSKVFYLSIMTTNGTIAAYMIDSDAVDDVHD